MEKFWQDALKVGGSVTVVMFVIYMLFGKLIDKFSPMNAENTLMITWFIVITIFLLASQIIESKNKKEATKSIENSIKDIEDSDLNIKVPNNGKIKDSLKNVKNSNIKIG